MFLFIKILAEAVIQALQELWNNRLRTFLSVLGITIGIFCVIAVQMMVESVQQNVKQSFARLGNDVVYIDRFPWDEDPSMNWWKYIKRPMPTLSEFKAIESKAMSAGAVAMRIIIQGQDLKHRNSVVENVPMAAATHEFGNIFNLEFEDGRFFTTVESQLGGNVIVLGSKLASNLFPNLGSAVGNEVRMKGKKLTVVGVLKPEGQSLLGDGFDEVAILPYNFMRRYIDPNSERVMPLIAVKAADGVNTEQLKDDLRAVLRAERKLKPKEDDNFALNQMSLLTAVIDNVFAVINAAGFLIGIFAILVGGFGIANIMFVSVKERTGIIGIKKSLGAKNYFILIEFLIEAVFLSILGGLLGLLAVWLLSLVGNNFVESFKLVLSMNNVKTGIFLSVVVGVLSGFIPALSAARMNPVEAIRQKF
ncbi:MAG TPA: ABC transporter permease [Chitinophagales bacterium]|nr:ABC transporter permease [Chitinophagales bacterium]